MTTPKLTFERRLELLESAGQVQADLQAAQDRLPQGFGKRWTYWALTSLTQSGFYVSATGNTFPIKFVDPVYTPTAGTQSLTTQLHSTFPRTVARTTNGQWCLPGELVMASPIPPPFGTTNKGRWLITPLKTYYYGYLNGPLTRLSSASVSVYIQGPAGNNWTDTGYDLTVWDAEFLSVGESLPTGTWIRFEWERVGWVVRDGRKSQAAAIATLQYDMCGNTATITNFKLLNGMATAVPPVTADNIEFKHRGLAGDKVLLMQSSLAEHTTGWLVIDVTGHDYDVYVGMRRTGDCVDFGCIEADVIRARLEICSAHISRVVFCLPPCPPQTSVQTSEEQTSQEQTSVEVQTSSRGCGEGEIDPDLIETAGDEQRLIISEVVSGTPVRRIAITVTETVEPCPLPPGGDPDPNKNPRSNDLLELFINYEMVAVWKNTYDPGLPASYGQGLYETYDLTCLQRYDLITGEALSADPNDREWVLTGSWDNFTIGLGGGGSIPIRISETQGAVWRPLGATTWETLPGALEILSFNPFHAIAQFSPPRYYPHTFSEATCGPVQVEFTEI